MIETLLALQPDAPALHGLYVQDAMAIGRLRAGRHVVRPRYEVVATAAPALPMPAGCSAITG